MVGRSIGTLDGYLGPTKFKLGYIGTEALWHVFTDYSQSAHTCYKPATGITELAVSTTLKELGVSSAPSRHFSATLPI